MTTIEELENKIKDYEHKQQFLLKFANYAYRADGLDNSNCFRCKKGDPYDMKYHGVDSDDNTFNCSDFQPYNEMLAKSDYNYEEYSNLPPTGVLYLLENDGMDIIHNRDLRKIYGYLDHKNKTFIKFELEINNHVGCYKFV